MAARTAPSMCCELLAYYRRRDLDGATDAEVERNLGWPPNIVTARRNDLVDDGLVVAKVERRRTVKLDRRGKQKTLRIVVWILTDAVRKAMARRRSTVTSDGSYPSCSGFDSRLRNQIPHR